MKLAFDIAQIVVGTLLILLILLQQKGEGLGSAFGGNGESIASTRRGAERSIFYITIILSAIFLGLALARMFIG